MQVQSLAELVGAPDASSTEVQAAYHRRVGHAAAIGHLVAGQPGRAYAEVMRSFLRQVRVLGMAYAGIPGRPYDQMGDLP